MTLIDQNKQVKRLIPNCHQDDILLNQLEHFLACVTTGDQPKVSVDDGIGALEIVVAAKRSQTLGRAVKL